MKDIKRRIKSVKSTMQITKAMELVASSKLRRAKDKVESTRPYFITLKESMEDIASNSKGIKSIYTQKRDVKNRCYIVINGDRGLCGGYNANVLKETLKEMDGRQDNIISIGRKATEYFAKRGYNMLASETGISEKPSYVKAKEMALKALSMYENAEIDELYLSYTEFTSTLVQEPRVIKLLPLSIESSKSDEAAKKRELTTYEPSAEAVFDSLVPNYISGVLYGGMVESSASEQAARRVAMESASDNADEMISQLELSYNRARQASITQEISEIVAGAEALN